MKKSLRPLRGFSSLSHHPHPSHAAPELDPKHLASSIKSWFRHRQPSTTSSAASSSLKSLLRLLSSKSDPKSLDSALSQLNLHLTEPLVLLALRHRSSTSASPSSLLPTITFFDWAGRQPHFHHTRSTSLAIFKILARSRLFSTMLDWLSSFPASAHLHFPRLRFHDTLVMGYAVAGKPDLSLSLLARMRFSGLDLDPFAYHVLLNALVEHRCFDAADVVSHQISLRRLESPVTSSIRLKSLCLQRRLDDALSLLPNDSPADPHSLSVLVSALCRRRRFDDALSLFDRFPSCASPNPAASALLRELVRAGQIDRALRFFSRQRSLGRGGVFASPVSAYNRLLSGLLGQNRLVDAYDLLVEMREDQLPPNRMTMNAALCFFCKAGLVDVAVELYHSRADIGLSPNSLGYNSLIAALSAEGSVDEACQVLKDSVRHGCIPGRRAFHLLADALCRQGKWDRMTDLVLMLDAIETTSKPSAAAYAKYIAALCKAGEAEKGYWISSTLKAARIVPSRYAYASLIYGFGKMGRGDVASKLLLEMQQSGYIPSRTLYRAVIGSLCKMGDAPGVFNLLARQLQDKGDSLKGIRQLYNYFIDGVGHAMKPELARQLFEQMSSEDIEPNLETRILVLQSYLKSKKIADALIFFGDLITTYRSSNRLYNIMIVGLAKAGKHEDALEMWRDVRAKGMIPSLHCYEELVQVLCMEGSYNLVVTVLRDFQKTGRRVSGFLCNVLLLHTLKGTELNRAWVQSGKAEGEESSSSGSLMLGQLVGAFSDGIQVKEHLGTLEEVIEQFFPVNIYTCNLLLRGLTMEGRIDCACEMFYRICKKGYKPNRWTYDIIVHGFCRLGKREEAESWMGMMYREGFEPTWYTIAKYESIGKRW